MDGDKKPSVSEYTGQCICDPCPTYNECMRADAGLLFCFTGRAASCTFEKKGCICPNCPVYKTFGFKKSYFCIRGTEQEQKQEQVRR